MAETLSEIEKINAAQRDLDLRKAQVMTAKIAAVEAALASPEGTKFVAALRAAADGMVDGTSRNTVNNILSSIANASMSMSFDKTTYDNVLATTTTTA